jgi:hypothetical protein
MAALKPDATYCLRAHAEPWRERAARARSAVAGGGARAHL